MQQTPIQQAIEIFNDKAHFNKWLLELTESEMSLVIEMMIEYRNQPSDNTPLDWQYFGADDYPDKKTFINSLNLDNTQIRDGFVKVEDMEKEYKRGFDDGVKYRDGQHKAYFTIEY